MNSARPIEDYKYMIGVEILLRVKNTLIAFTVAVVAKFPPRPTTERIQSKTDVITTGLVDPSTFRMIRGTSAPKRILLNKHNKEYDN